MQLSVLMPAYDEADNLVEVVPATVRALERLGQSYEILIVDDGSKDATPEVMASLQAQYPAVRYIRLRRNMGKSAALTVGFEQTTGAILVLMDADGQDDPDQIPTLLDALDGGLDQVTGSRVLGRHDRFVKRNTSKIFNAATAKVTGVPGKDFNSGFKALRREVVDVLDVHGELHRYIPVLADWAGFRVGEVPVEHHERLHGTTKFGRSRFWRGFLDLFTIKFLTTHTRRPFHLFGGLGVVMGFIGSLLLVWMFISKLMGNAVGERPALQIGVLLLVVGVQLMSLGLLAELFIMNATQASPNDYAREYFVTATPDGTDRPAGAPAATTVTPTPAAARLDPT